MSSDLPIRPGLNLPLEEVRVRTSRSSGPGGQHANVTASRVEASFDVEASVTLSDAQKARIRSKLGPVVTAAAQDTRSQARNRALALERLADRLGKALEVSRPRTPTRPTLGSRRRRIESKRRRGETKRARRRPDVD
jgi:ribosome-associated protein